MASRVRTALGAAGRAAAVALAVVIVPALATGWLYWLRARVASWPGPRVHDALPLDELPSHDSVPLLVFVAVFAIAGVILGLAARAARLDRLAAGLGLAAGVGAWLYVADAICLFFVRQIPFGPAFRAAAGLQPVYLAAALAGVAGALLGRGTGSGAIAYRLLAWLVAVGGLIDLISVLLPRRHAALGLVERIGPGIVDPAVHVLLAPAGVLLLIGSRGLMRRNRRAWGLCVALLGLSAALSLLRGSDYSAAIVTGLIAVALLASRQEFPFRGDPAAEPSALLRLAGMLAAAIAYGVVTLFAYRTVGGLPFSLTAALWDSVRALAGLAPHGSEYLPAGFAGWFPASEMSIAAIGVAWAVWVWIRPWRQRLFAGAGTLAQAEEIVRRWGGDTLAPFALRQDKQWFFTGQSLIAYRVVRGVAVSGDPVGPAGEAGDAIAAFLAHARSRGWHVVVLGAAGGLLDTYREHGLRPLYHGDEAVIDTAAFCLAGRTMRTIRQAARRLDRNGYQAEVVMAGDVPPALRAELTAVDQAWLRGGTRKGFTMELDGPFRLGDGDALFVIGRDAGGRVAGFLHLAVCRPSRSLTLSSMPRRADTPNGFNAWLIINATAWAGEHGFGRISLNFSPFAGLLTAGAARTSARRIERRALLRLKDMLALQLDNLLRFNRQFSPAWLARYVVVEHRADLPRVALAAMAAEGYLPYAGLIRGAGWSPPEPPAQAPREPPPQPAEPQWSGGRR
ncbi:phosphatidylglycerol lysyltransferase domain-containing protein [Trebonia sp.]|uniref:bifunctional lysylphosphatidylglycerol flippase/synthetase MprF n=1 Tax=Trebonia sp. TaxID=2767075 RepID=UPI0026205E84|nr:phosphatidylglycerol lysyltransferase domain-containing protein [Trebonia sp.]